MNAPQKIGYFTGRPIPAPTHTLRVTIASPDGTILRAYDVTLIEDTEYRAADAIGTMIGEFVGDDRNGSPLCREVTNEAAFKASLAMVDETDFPEHERYEEAD